MNLMVNNDDREVRVTSYRGTYALQSDYVLCILLRFLSDNHFYLLGWGGELRGGIQACVELIINFKLMYFSI